MYKKIAIEAGKKDLPILPLGLKEEVDLDKKEIRFLEKPMED